MAMVTPVADALDEGEHRGHLLRALLASTIGTTIEWYDFFLYSLASGLVFAKLYFPGDDPLTGTLNAFAIYRRRLRRPAGRRRDLRPLWRPDRAQIDADHHLDPDGGCHLPGGPCAHL